MKYSIWSTVFNDWIRSIITTDINEAYQKLKTLDVPMCNIMAEVKEYNGKHHTDLLNMIDDIQEHVGRHGGHIVQCNNITRLLHGYRCEKTGKIWLISINDLRCIFNKERVGDRKLLMQAMENENGQQALLNALNGK